MSDKAERSILEDIRTLRLPEPYYKIDEIFPLVGLGYGQVFEIKAQNRFAVLKCSKQSREKLFYEKLACQINRAGVATPELYWSYEARGVHWILIEKLDQVLPEKRWRVDEEVFENLAKLHRVKVDLKEVSPEAYSWTESLTESVVSVFFKVMKSSEKRLLMDLQKKYQFLFEPKFFISGDPSGRNWGLRKNQEIALFDWERFGFGSPQLDLACVAFGSTSSEVFKDIAKGYLKFQPLEYEIDQFAKEILVARIYTCLKMLDSHRVKESHIPKNLIPRITQELLQLIKVVS